jgi:membrane-associated phospholipid phosphatase
MEERSRVRLAKFTWLLLLAGVVFPVYFVIGAVWQNPDDPQVLANTARVVTTLDRSIPFAPIWMFIYGAVYTFMALPIMTVRDGLLIRRTAMAYLFVLGVSYSVYVIYPITTKGFRPDYPQLDDKVLWQWGAALEYFCDPPMNCLPSLHLGIAFIAGFSTWKADRFAGTIAISFAAMIGVSTTFVKQHYLIDVVTGVLTALVAYAIFIRSLPRPARGSEDAHAARLGLLKYVGVFLAFVGVLGVLFLVGLRPWHVA